MQRNLTLKAVVIAATIIVCLFGIIGFPKFLGGVGIPLSLAQLSRTCSRTSIWGST